MKLLVVHPGADYSTADVWSGIRGALRDRGHEIYDYNLSVRIMRGAQYLDFCWRRAKKNDPTIERPNAADAVYMAGQGILERALRQQVDWVLIVSSMFCAPDWLILLRRAGVKVGVVFTESPYDDLQQLKVAKLVDVAWTNERTSVDILNQGCPTYYLRHAYNPDIHRPEMATDDVPAHDVVFVGTAFPERIELLKAVNWDGIDLGLYGNWTQLNGNDGFRKYVRGGPIDNAKTAALYRKAKIGLNLYRESMGWGKYAPRIGNAESVNPRVMELAACGVFMLSNYRPEMDEVFSGLVPTFEDGKGLEQQIRQWLPDEGAKR